MTRACKERSDQHTKEGVSQGPRQRCVRLLSRAAPSKHKGVCVNSPMDSPVSYMLPASAKSAMQVTWLYVSCVATRNPFDKVLTRTVGVGRFRAGFSCGIPGSSFVSGSEAAASVKAVGAGEATEDIVRHPLADERHEPARAERRTAETVGRARALGSGIAAAAARARRSISPAIK